MEERKSGVEECSERAQVGGRKRSRVEVVTKDKGSKRGEGAGYLGVFICIGCEK